MPLRKFSQSLHKNALRNASNTSVPRVKTQQLITFAIFFVLCGSLGLHFVFQSRAATLAVSQETEDGSLNGNTTILSDTSASGNSGVKFGSACPLTSKLVPSCGALWGAWVSNSGLTALEAKTGRKFDLFQSYHDFSTTNSGAIPSTYDSSMMAGGRILLASWQSREYSSGVVHTWAEIATGADDASRIIPQATRIKALGSTKIFLSFAPEMDGSAATQYGTAADFIAAYRHIHDVFAAQGVTNVVWVWTVEGGPGQSPYTKVASFYPGDTYVDWVGYDPYNFYTCNGDNLWRSTATVFGTYYNWVGAGNLGAGAATKPMILDEYGSHDDPADPTRNQQWYANIPATIKTMPRIKALSQFDSGGTFCSTQLDGISTVDGATIQPGTLTGFTQAGQDPYLNQ